MPLSAEQRAAVEHDAGPLIVLAGPGTGKTRVITARVAHLVRDKGADPARVLAVTFTNKAAGELKDRLGSLLTPAQAQNITASTLHAYGVRLLTRFGDILGLPSEIEILDEAQQRRLARELIRANRLYRASVGRGIDHAVTHALDVAHELVSAGIAPAEALRRTDAGLAALSSDGSPEAKARRAELSIAREGIELARLLDEACLDRGTARYDDLIAWPMMLLRRSETVAAIVRHECRHVVVDEFQDLNATQIEWLSLLCPPTGGRSRPDVCVVGDDDQSIYAFRGADERAFDRFAATWPNTTTLRLTTNYRSGPAVIAASNAIIRNAGYRFDDSKFGVPGPAARAMSAIELVRLSSDTRAGETAAAMIRAQVDANPAIDLSKIAVIARTGTELLRCAGALEAAGIPYTSSVRDASREDPGVRAVLAWAALVVDPTRTWAARAVLTRPPFSIDASTLATLEHRYRQQRAWANANPGEEEPGPFVAWLSAHAPAGFEEPLRRAAEVERSIADIASIDTADHAVMHAIRVSGVAHAEALPPRERAARVRALVALVRFTRERLPRLDEPRGLRELLAYIDDLPEKEKGFAQTPSDRVMAGELAADEPGVRLLTAHASKGLEFDTVYLLRCTSPHGFPSPKTDPPVLPEGVADPDPLGRDARARVDDEERRIFFVALTRAERRAILLGKIPKKSSATNYAIELRSALGPDLAEHDEADVVPQDALADTLTSEEIESGLATERAAVLATARRAARRDAARALDDAEQAEAPDDALADRLRRAADRLAMIRCVERTGQAPRWTRAAGLSDEAAALADRLRPDGAPGADFPGISGPMSLSFTQIKQYLACPRCYYLEYIQQLPTAPSDAINIGKAVHRALQVYAAAWAEADNEGRPTPGWDQLEEETKRWFFREWPREQELDHEQLARATAMARTFHEQLHPHDAHIVAIEQKFAFPFEVDGVQHSIRGMIDRIDQSPGNAARIIDYKTGFPTKKLLQPDKTDLQMSIYAMALPALKIEPGPGATAEYWMLASGEIGDIPLASLNLAKVRETIANAVRGMAAGNWPKGRDCSGLCEFLDEPED
jgi:DNA helicase-2/ATP-dependent DNA helicase PcrA